MIHLRLTKQFLLCLAALAFLAQSSLAETFYVSNAGFNNRNRTQAQNRATPWRTIQRGIDAANAGDTVVILDGTYFEHVRLNRSGFENNSIRLLAENIHGPLLVGSIQGSGISHWIIDGMRITNRRQGGPTTRGIFFNFSHHITIRDNRVFSCRGGGINLDQCDWLLLEWNITHHNAFWDPDQHSGISIYQPQERPADASDQRRSVGITIRNNTSYGNENRLNNVNFGRPTDGNGIVIDDTRNEQSPFGNFQTYPRRILVENNLSYLNGGQGIHCFQSEGLLIRNNTCFRNMFSFEFGSEISVVDSSGIDVYNNIMVARPGRNANLEFESSDVWWNYNLISGPTQGARNRSRTIFSFPFFRQGTFDLESFSPAIGAGLTNFNVFPFDVNGRQRVQRGAVDLGANETNN